MKMKSFILVSFVSFLTIVTIFFSGSSAFAGSPMVSNTIPDQVVQNGQMFDMSFGIYDVFNDTDGDDLSVTVKQADDSALPAWLIVGTKSLSPSLIGSLDTTGTAYDIAVVGNYAYIADDTAGLKVIDISTPPIPSLTGTLDTPGNARGVAVVGNYAYVADGLSGLQIIDVSIPDTPNLIGTLDTDGWAGKVAVSGNYAYVADGMSGLQVINITVPSNPSLTTTFDVTTAGDVTVIGNLAYVVDSQGFGLRIIDISTPSNPSLIGGLDTLGFASHVTVYGNYAYVADGSSGLQIIDVSNPSIPSLVGTLDTLGSAQGVFYFGNYAYIADGTEGLQIIDVATSASPRLVGTFNTPGDAKGVAVVGDYAYVADGSAGLKIIGETSKGISFSGIPSISNVGPLSLKATASDGGNEVSDMFTIDVQNSAPTVVGSIPNVTTHHGQMFDMSFTTANIFGDPNANILNVIVTQANDTALPAWLTVGTKPIVPKLIDKLTVGSVADGVAGIALADNYAYVVTWEEEPPDFFTIKGNLSIMDISNPASPSLVGTLADIFGDIVVVGNYAYTTGGWSAGLQIIDISIPSNPKLVGTYSDTDAYEVVVVGNYAYVADGSIGLKIIDISNPANPSLVGTLDLSGQARGIAVVGAYAYVANGGPLNLQVIDISTPSAPSLVGTLAGEGARRIVVIGNYAYIAAFNEGLQVVDISNPTSPSLVATYDTSGRPTGVYVVGNYVYVIGTAGLKVIDISVPSTPNLMGGVLISNNTVVNAEIAVTGNYAYAGGDGSGAPGIIEDVGAGISLSGVPASSDIGTLGLKATASDGIDSVSTTFSINVQQNTAPTVWTISKRGLVNTALTFNATNFTDNFSDINNDILTKIQVTSLPINGVLKLSGTAVALDQEIDVGDLSNLTFEPNIDWNGNTNFAWKGHDGTEYSASSANINISVNNAPTIADISKSGTENTALTFRATDFTSHFTAFGGGSLTKIQITSLPTNGVLKLVNSGPVTIDQEIFANNINNNLIFEPDENWIGTTSFGWKGYDGFDYSDAGEVVINVTNNRAWIESWWPLIGGGAVAVIGISASIATITTAAVIMMKKRGLAFFRKQGNVPPEKIMPEKIMNDVQSMNEYKKATVPTFDTIDYSQDMQESVY